MRTELRQVLFFACPTPRPLKKISPATASASLHGTSGIIPQIFASVNSKSQKILPLRKPPWRSVGLFPACESLSRLYHPYFCRSGVAYPSPACISAGTPSPKKRRRLFPLSTNLIKIFHFSFQADRIYPKIPIAFELT